MYVASGIDRHPDRTEIYFRLQIQGNRKLIPYFRTFRRVFGYPYISFFHLLVNGFVLYSIYMVDIIRFRGNIRFTNPKNQEKARVLKWLINLILP